MRVRSVRPSCSSAKVSNTTWRNHSSATVGAAVDLDRGAGDVTRVLRAQERADPPEVGGIADRTRPGLPAARLAASLAVQRRDALGRVQPGSSEFTVTPSAATSRASV